MPFIRVIGLCQEIAAHTDQDDYQAVLRIHAQIVNQDSLAQIPEKRDLQALQERYLTTFKKMG